MGNLFIGHDTDGDGDTDIVFHVKTRNNNENNIGSLIGIAIGFSEAVWAILVLETISADSDIFGYLFFLYWGLPNCILFCIFFAWLFSTFSVRSANCSSEKEISDVTPVKHSPADTIPIKPDRRCLGCSKPIKIGRSSHCKACNEIIAEMGGD